MDMTQQYISAQAIETDLRQQMFDTVVCACCGHRVPGSAIHPDTAHTGDPRLELLASTASAWVPNPTRVNVIMHASTSAGPTTSEYSIHASYEQATHVSFCDNCNLCLSQGELPVLCIKTVDVGAHPTGRVGHDDEPVTILPALTWLERIVISFVKTSQYMTTIYDRNGKTPRAKLLKGHVTAFLKAPPDVVANAMREHYPLSISKLGENINVVLVTGDTRGEALRRAKNLKGLQVDSRKCLAWAEHLAKAYSEMGILVSNTAFTVTSLSTKCFIH